MHRAEWEAVLCILGTQVMQASIKVCVAKRALVVTVSIVAAGIAAAQTLRNPPPLDSLDPSLLTEVPRSVPDPVALAAYIADKTAAIQLGKALFWDMQVGSDGITACASCHFHAGADSRSKNQVSPGVLATPEDVTFSAQLGGAPNRQLTAADFPFHRLSDPNDRFSSVVSDTNDVVSSQSVHFGLFKDSVSGQPVDVIQYAPDPEGFQINQINVRRVEGRNTPTVINACSTGFCSGTAVPTPSSTASIRRAKKSLWCSRLINQNC